MTVAPSFLDVPRARVMGASAAFLKVASPRALTAWPHAWSSSEPRLLGIDGERIVQNSAAVGASTSKISSLFTKTATPKRVFYIRDIKILKIDEQDPSVLHLGFAEGGQVSRSHAWELFACRFTCLSWSNGLIFSVPRTREKWLSFRTRHHRRSRAKRSTPRSSIVWADEISDTHCARACQMLLVIIKLCLYHGV